jgi:hypothetical protein
MEQRALKNVKNPWNTNIYSYLETSGGQSANLYLNIVHLFNTVLIRHQWQLQTGVFLQWCLIHAFLLEVLMGHPLIGTFTNIGLYVSGTKLQTH